MSSEGIEHVKALCSDWVASDVHKALCVLVARRGVVCLHEAYGRSGPHGAPPLEKSGIFPMLSISKSVTATVLMRLVQDGAIGLTRPVQEYLPDFRGKRKGLVCVHHLLTHTSGIGGPPMEADAADDPAEQATAQDVGGWLGDLLRSPLGYEPGSEMRYTGANYVVIGEIVRRVTGRTIDQLASELIFEPLGMVDTSYALPDDRVSRAIGWNAMPGLGDTSTAEFRADPAPNIGVHSTAWDIGAFGQMFLNGGAYGDARVLHPSTVAEMTRDQIPGVGANFSVGAYTRHFAEASWGYGWGVASDQKWPRWPSFPRGSFNHSGGGGMLLWADPTNEIVGVYLAICRFSPQTFDTLSNNDLFVNAVVASVA